MSIISSCTALSGLKNANLVERAQCSGEKMKNNFKYNLTNLAITGATVGAGAAIVKSKTLQNAIGGGISKGANLLAKTKIGSEISKGASKAVSALKANPNMAKALAAVGAVGLVATSIVSHLQTHENGKIEGKFQAKANMDENFKANA